MHFQFVQPTGFLKDFVRYYCFMESASLEADMMERVIPVDHVQLMFHYRNPFVVHQTGQTTSKQPHSIISGLSDTFSDVSTHGETGVAFICFYPAGACQFFDFPLSEIANQSLDMSDVLGSEIRHLEERLYETESIREKVSIIEHFLINRYSPIPSHDHLLIQKGIDRIKDCKGQIHVASLSHSLSISPKTLERKFSQYLGKTTKQVIKLMRFQAVLHDFGRHKNCLLTDMAYNNGYFDQSHFIHDFKSFSGYTPKEFAAKFPDFNMTTGC
jgi:AraC-like DNA-binding protein